MVIVVTIVMLLVYTLMDRELIFAKDSMISKKSNNDRVIYKYAQWEKYGYLDYVTYAEYLGALQKSGEIDEDTRAAAVSIGRKAEKDTDLTREYVRKFTEYYESQGYTVERLDAVMLNRNRLDVGGKQQLFAYKNKSVFKRLLKITDIISSAAAVISSFTTI